MKKQLQYLSIVLLLFLLNIAAFAQAPNISYSPSTSVFTVSTAITTLTPTNTGGAVPANVYGTVTTYAGTGVSGSTNGAIASAKFNTPRGIAFDYAATPNMYVADVGNTLVRKIVLSTGIVSNLGSTISYGITYDNAGNLFLLDNAGSAIHKVTTGGVVTTFTTSGVALSSPSGIVFDPVNNVFYISNSGNNKILKMTTAGVVSVLAGSGTAGSADGTGAAATFSTPNGVAVDASGNVYVADQGNSEIRKITSAGVVTTIAGSTTPGSTDGNGTSASFNTPSGLDLDISGNIYVTDKGNELIRMITQSGDVTTVAGNGTQALLNGVGTTAEFNQSRGITVNKTTGDIYIADYGNNVIRKFVGTGYSISPALPAGLSFNNATGAISGTPSSVFAATTYTITAFNTSGSSSTTISLACGRSLVWDGSSSTTWSTAANWTPANIPQPADNLSIGTASFKNHPTVTASTSANSITLGSSTSTLDLKQVTLTVNSTRTLTVNSSITVNSGATTIITGAATSSLTMAPGSNIAVNGTKLTISTAGFTLQSDATGSASIGAVTTTNFITSGTTVNVQRYVTGGSSTYRGYRLMSSPVYVSGVSPHVYNLDYIKASSWVTGVAGNGFDKTGNPTLYLFREDQAPSNASYGAGNWPGVSKMTNALTYNLYLNSVATNINLTPGNGFLFFFRGDKAAATVGAETTTTYVPTNTTFTATGALNIGSITVSDWYNSVSPNLGYTTVTANTAVRGYNLVGNPYPSNIDWDQFSSTVSSNGIYGPNVSNTVYVLDPVSHNYGAYTAGSGVPGTNNATNVIASGQGFFVRALGSSLPNPQLTFNESAKTTSQVIAPNLLLGTPVSASNTSYMHLKLAKDNLNTDETLFFFDNASGTNYKQGADALYKIGNGYVSLASRSSDHIDLAIKSIALPKQQSISLGLDVNAKSDGIYSLSLKDIVSVPRIYDIWLMDTYKRDSVDLRANKTYSFNIFKADTNSFGSNRFSLVIRQNPGFAYHLLNFTASKVSTARQVVIAWVTENEQNYTNFTVERSIDGGKTFDVLGGLQGSAAGTYSLLDKNPISGQNLYRLKQEDINNTISYTKPQTVQYSDLSNNIAGKNINIYPNPVSATINLSISTPTNEAASYNIKIMNSSGAVVKEITSSQPSWQGSVNYLKPGIYVMRVTNTKTQSFVGENKFVKL